MQNIKQSSLKTAEKRKLSPEEEKVERRNNWLAPAGSPRERQFLGQWASRKDLTAEDRAMVRALLDKPDDLEQRNALFSLAAKKQMLGPVVYDLAMERHTKLIGDEWHVACLRAEGFTQKEIALMIGMSVSSVQKKILSIKQTIALDLHCGDETVNLGVQVRWFLGL